MLSNFKFLDGWNAPTVAFILFLLLLAYIRKRAIQSGPSASSGIVPEDNESAHFLLSGVPSTALDAAGVALGRLGFDLLSCASYRSHGTPGSASASSSDSSELLALRVSPNRTLVAKIAVAINLPVDMSYSLFDYRLQHICGDILSHADIPHERCIYLQEPKPHKIRAELSQSKLHLVSHSSEVVTGNDISTVGAERAVLRASVAAADSGVIFPAAVAILLHVPFLWSSDGESTGFIFQVIFPFVTCLWVIFSVRQWQRRMDAVLAAADTRYLHPPASISGSDGGLTGLLRELFRSAHIVEFGLLVGIGAMTSLFIALQDYFSAASFAETEWVSYVPTVIHGGCIPLVANVVLAFSAQRELRSLSASHTKANSESPPLPPEEAAWAMLASKAVNDALAWRAWSCFLQCVVYLCPPVYLMLMRQDTLLVQIFIYSVLLSEQILHILASRLPAASDCSSNDTWLRALKQVKVVSTPSASRQSPPPQASLVRSLGTPPTSPAPALTPEVISPAESTPSSVGTPVKTKSGFLQKQWFGSSKTKNNGPAADASPSLKPSDEASSSSGQGGEHRSTPDDKSHPSIWSSLRYARKAISHSKSPPLLSASMSRDDILNDDDVSMMPLDGTPELDDLSVSDVEGEHRGLVMLSHLEEDMANGSVGEPHAAVTTQVKRSNLFAAVVDQLRRQRENTFENHCDLLIKRGFLLLFASTSPLLCLSLCVHRFFDNNMSSQTARDCSISRPAAMCRHSVPGSYARAAEAKVIASAVLRDVQKVAGTVRLWAVTLRIISIIAIFTNISIIFATDSLSISLPSGVGWIAIAVGSGADDGTASNSVSRFLVGSVMLNAMLLVVVLSGVVPNIIPRWAREAQFNTSFSQMSNALLASYDRLSRVAAAGRIAGPGKASRDLLLTVQALEKELSLLKLESLYRLCDKAMDNSVFIVLCCFPFALQNLFDWRWYWSMPLALFVNAYYFNRSDESRKRLAVQIVSDRKLFQLISSEVPQWIGCDTEPCAWVNDMMSQSWSHMAQYGNLKAREALEGMLQRQKSGVVKKVSIRNLTMGSEPPRILSIRLFRQSKDKTKIELEVDVRWVSNCSMSMQVGALGTMMTAEVGELRLSGTCRIILGPLIADVPPFPMFRFAFTREPSVDFSLRFGESGSIDVLNLEPIAKIFNRMLKKVISSSALYPKWNHVIMNRTLVTPAMLNEHLLQPSGIVSLQVLGCNALPIADISSSDPFVEVRFVENVFKTEIVFRNLNPRWENENFDLLVYDNELQFVNLSVWDYDRGTMNDFLGEVNVPFKALQPHTAANMELALENCKKADATILVRLTYLPFDIRKEGASRDHEDSEIDWEHASGQQPAADSDAAGAKTRPGGSIAISGALILSDITCVRLSEDAKKGDPVLSVDVGGIVKKSKPQPNTADPAFPETFALIVRDSHTALLTISVSDARRTHKSAFGSSWSPSLGALRLRLDELFPALLVRSRVSEALDAAVHEMELEGSFGLISFKAKFAPVKQ